MNQFEQLIEYVINDEEQKARELFHDIVVAKSREIYESLMEEDEEDIEESEDIEEAMGGDAADDLIDDVEMEEESDMHMEAEEEEEEEEFEMGSDEGSDEGGDEPATKDDIMDLEDKIDELIADFESLMDNDTDNDMSDMDDMDSMGDGDDFGADEGGDAIEMDDTEEMMPMAEAVSLKAAPTPVKSEEGGINKKAVYASNAGARGAMAHPVKMTGDVAQGRPAPATKDLIGKVGNSPAQGTQKPAPATKPHLGQATGVNVKSPLPGGRKG